MIAPEKRPSHRVWRIVRWLPLAALALALGVILVLFLLGGMQRVTAWYLLQLLVPVIGLAVLLGCAAYVLIVLIARRRFSKAAAFTGLAGLLCLAPAALLVFPVAYPAGLDSTGPAATVRLPADGPLRVFWGGDRLETNQHAITPDQRWAYDLGTEPYFHGSTNLEDYGCYGVPVVAPIAGQVSAAHDGVPDQAGGQYVPNLEAPLGNHVIIRMETGTYLVIAHLKPGSVAVAAGETVVEGQVIGACGNSGNTSEPHIHIHHQRQDPSIYPLNFAEGLPLFFRDHDGAPMPVGGVRIEGETATATGDLVQHLGP